MATAVLQTLLSDTFRGFHDIRLAAAFSGMTTWVLLTVGVGVLWLVAGRASLSTVVLLAAGSGLANALLAGWLLHRKVAALPSAGTAESGVSTVEVLRVAWPLLVMNLIAFVLQQAGLWIVGAFQPQEDVAIYGAATRLAVLVGMPLSIANAVVPPLIAEKYALGERRELERMLRTVSTLAGIPAFVALSGLILLGGPILSLVFGDFYRQGALALALLSAAGIVQVLAGSCGETLMMTGRQVLLMSISLLSGAVTVGAGLAVVGRYGTTGVAAAVAAGVILHTALTWLGARYTTGIWTHVGFKGVAETIRGLR
jgi:O-antigen/teichoic acid export membrane protein